METRERSDAACDQRPQPTQGATSPAPRRRHEFSTPDVARTSGRHPSLSQSPVSVAGSSTACGARRNLWSEPRDPSLGPWATAVGAASRRAENCPEQGQHSSWPRPRNLILSSLMLQKVLVVLVILTLSNPAKLSQRRPASEPGQQHPRRPASRTCRRGRRP